MKIAVIGANGKAGSRILEEAASRGHEVTAFVRDASKAPSRASAVVVKDVLDLKAADVAGYDVVVSAYGVFDNVDLHADVTNVLIDALKGADARLIMVGGAGSLFVDPEKTQRVVDTPDFPEMFRPLARAQGKALSILEASSGVKWTFLSPSAEIALGKRTGSYLKGKDHLLVNSQGKSYVSYEDYAVAVVDEIENPQHVNERFTVASES